MNKKDQTIEEAYSRIEIKRRRKFKFTLLLIASWIAGLFFLRHAVDVIVSINSDNSYEEVLNEFRNGLLYAGLGFSFLFLVPNIWVGRLPTREELTLLKRRKEHLNNVPRPNVVPPSGQGDVIVP